MKSLISAIALAVLAACAHDHTWTRDDAAIINAESPMGSPWPGQILTDPLRRR
jgi:hypothetical protein